MKKEIRELLIAWEQKGWDYGVRVLRELTEKKNGVHTDNRSADNLGSVEQREADK